MTQITTYKQADEFFSKARNKDAGRPLGVVGWRLFRNGDVYHLNYNDKMFATVHPNNHLVLTGVDVSNGMVNGASKVLPIMMVYRSTDNYRVHIRKEGKPKNTYDAYGLTTFHDWRTGGLRYIKDLTINLTTRTVVDYVEPVRTVDTDARKDWLRNSARVKKHLKTIAKLGGFDPLVSALPNLRWQYRTIGANPADLNIMLTALAGGDTQPLVQRVAEHMRRAAYSLPLSVESQLGIIDDIFDKNSVALRRALGVITSEV